MQRKKIPILPIIILGIIALVVINHNKNAGANKTVSQKNGYQKIYSVKGSEFQVNQQIVDRATAVTKISNDSRFVPEEFYSYTDGESKYLTFNMKGIVIACEKGTTFNFEASEDKEEALTSNSLMGIWFDKDTRNFKVKDEKDRCEADAKAQVAITTDLYGDFVGKLVTITDKTNEWALFVGCPGTKYKDLPGSNKKIIEGIAETFTLSDGIVYTPPEYEFTISGDMASKLSESDNKISESEDQVQKPEEPVYEVSENNMPISADFIVPVSDNSVSDNAVSENSVSDNSVSDNSVSDNTVSENETVSGNEEESVSGDLIEVSDETPVEEPEAPVEPTEESSEEAPSEETSELQGEPAERPSEGEIRGIEVSNEETAEVDETIHNSSLGSLLRIGNISTSSVYTGEETESVKMITVRLNRVEEKPEDTPDKDYILPDGCHWEMAEFDAQFQDGEHYIDTRLIGADGKHLKYRGIKYPMRTYDDNKNIKTDGGIIYGYRFYYVVPNGCTDYILKIGGVTNQPIPAAYYHVNHK